MVIFGGMAGLMRIENACVSACPVVSATRTVNDDVPGAFGVPEITPVAGFKFRFCGSVPSDDAPRQRDRSRQWLARFDCRPGRPPRSGAMWW